MNREIKFRAWNTTTHTMHPFINSKNNWSYSFLNQAIFIWLQFTGLIDKNGKEIYEGDIVSGYSGYPIHPVKFEDGCFTWDGWPLNWDYENQEPADTSKWATIVGNIYEHPKLIEQ